MAILIDADCELCGSPVRYEPGRHDLHLCDACGMVMQQRHADSMWRVASAKKCARQLSTDIGNIFRQRGPVPTHAYEHD